MKFTKRAIPDTINFLKPTSDSFKHLEKISAKKTAPQKALFYFFVFLIITVFGFSTRIVISSSEVSRNFSGGNLFTQIKNLFTKKESDVAGASENRINIALLGIGGEGHQGPYLTDSIILLSIKPREEQVALLSIPRDLYVYSRTLGGNKINSIYALGEGQGNGGQIVKEVIGETFGLPVHYYARIDFDGFIELIDTLGGIDIYVPNAFIDHKFPAPNFATQTVSFDIGWQHFDGLTSLQYARSRHGTAGEGSDFARAKRQQQILLALKEKILKLDLLLRPDKIDKIIQILGHSIQTDLAIWEVVKLAKLANKIDNKTIVQKILDDSPSGELRSIIGINGSFLLMPKDSQKSKYLAQNIFDLYEMQQQQPKVVLQNGTTIPGLANLTKSSLEQDGFMVIKTENATQENYTKTVIFDLTHGTKEISLNYLRNKLEAQVSTYTPVELWRENEDVDFVIILGIN